MDQVPAVVRTRRHDGGDRSGAQALGGALVILGDRARRHPRSRNAHLGQCEADGRAAAALDGRLPARGRVLEVGSGTGRHIVAFAQRWPGLQWIPSNLLQIAPWSACEGLLAGAAALLKPDGQLFIAGCFTRGGQHLSEGNAEFDRSLRHRDPAWGVRDVGEVTRAAAQVGLRQVETIALPSNNLMLMFARRGA